MNPVLIEIAGFKIYWYTLFVLVSVFIAISLTQREGKRFGVKLDFIFNMCFWTVIFGLIGARVYYVIFNWDYFGQNLTQIPQMWNGGLAIHGGILAGLLTIYLYCKKYQVRMLRYLDFIVPALIFAQAIGRWGNFFNQEAHGTPTSASAISNFFTPDFVVQGMYINGVYYLPMFYYEFLACLLLFVFLLVIRRNKYIKVGSLTALYLVGYGAIRFFIEIYRTDALMIGAFKVAHIISVIMFLIGVVILMINVRKSKFEDLYNDTSNIEKGNF